MPTKEVKSIKEIKLKYVSEKENEHGTHHFFAALDENLLKESIDLGKTMNFLIWEYNVKFYMKINAVKVKEAQVENCFKKGVLYIMDLTFTTYGFQKGGEQITGYSISEINKIYSNTNVYRNVIVRIKFKTIFRFKSL